ncbi:hypothetical protein CANCADRAFT_108488 [Tortispora caseinolytica NRRL Y-17796]|uniref:Protein-lysine N-methyltransferase EFM4 n=1 Tax=Tortispora caseinolytica NRRL Y-17796 TaxID=767744 RepID=A0A1E4TFY8_9ASCO|nr:hypothetical protein CANCADRAFT_108488 [Tortispora caseinolytica NRRL Y-17796]
MDLEPSKLGTKDYWDEFYNRELSNLRESGDTGERWFDENGAVDRIVNFIEENDILKGDVLDLGTGNGHLLFELQDNEPDTPYKFTGVDYSHQSVELANSIAENRENMEFIQADILDPSWARNRKWKVILDKGTMDAIALMAPADVHSERPLSRYPKAVEQLLADDGVLIITSCNLTQSELKQLITQNTKLSAWKSIQYPIFEFAGQKGQSICSLAFKFADTH